MQEQLCNGDFGLHLRFGDKCCGACAERQDAAAVKQQRNGGSERLTGAGDGERHCWSHGAPALRVANANGGGEAAAVIPANGNRHPRVARSAGLLPGGNLGAERGGKGGINRARRWKWHGARRTGAPIHLPRGRNRCD